MQAVDVYGCLSRGISPRALRSAAMRFRWRRAQFEVAHVEGPERIAMEWWRNEKPTRDYFRVETRQGQRFWLYREGPYGAPEPPRWFLHGFFP